MRTISLIENWGQTVTWLVLLFVLYSIVSGKIRFDLTAFAGLLLLGILGLREPGRLFSGFSSPALFTIATVIVISVGIVESGLLSGLGQKIASKMRNYKSQIFALFLSAGFMSAFMNNVGAISIVLPTAKRMAQRAKVPHSAFGIPIIYASILGGSMSLIGTASNLIVSTYRLEALGQPFRIFDFLYHGLAIMLSGIFVLFICSACGLSPIKNPGVSDEKYEEEPGNLAAEAIPRDTRKSLVVLLTLVAAIVLAALGAVHPSIAFGIVAVIWVFLGVLPYKSAIQNINIPIIIFLGSMFGISAILNETGALAAAVELISPLLKALPPFLLILVFLFITALFSNILDNSTASVLMAPVAITLWRTGAVSFNPDALLMAVAAGASLGIVMPTNQSTIVVMQSMVFPRRDFIKTGAAIAAAAGLFSSFVIYSIWC